MTFTLLHMTDGIALNCDRCRSEPGKGDGDVIEGVYTLDLIDVLAAAKKHDIEVHA